MPYKDPEVRKQKAKEASRRHYLKNKEAKKARNKQWAEDNAERMKELQAAWYLENKEKVREQADKWARENPNKVKQMQKESRLRTGSAKLWKQANRAKSASYASKRRAQQSNATPSWLSEDDLWLIEEIFQHREDMTVATGVQHEVDHVLPLINKNVCGLHVPWNLRVITCYENRVKGNTL